MENLFLCLGQEQVIFRGSEIPLVLDVARIFQIRLSSPVKMMRIIFTGDADTFM